MANETFPRELGRSPPGPGRVKTPKSTDSSNRARMWRYTLCVSQYADNDLLAGTLPYLKSSWLTDDFSKPFSRFQTGWADSRHQRRSIVALSNVRFMLETDLRMMQCNRLLSTLNGPWVTLRITGSKSIARNKRRFLQSVCMRLLMLCSLVACLGFSLMKTQ